MAQPDVRVRLSAEGVAEVVAALEKIRNKAQSVSKSAARETQGWATALGNVRGLLTTLGVATSAAGIIAFVHHTADATENLGVLAQRLQTSTENIEALQLAAKQARVDLESSSRSLAKFMTISSEASVGKGKGVKPLQALGFNAQEIKEFGGKDLAERLDAIGQRFARFPDGPTKSAIAIQLFSTRGLALLPLLERLGQQGVGPLKKKLEELGAIVDTDVVGAVNGMNDELDVLGQQLHAVSANFVGGLAPAVQQSARAIETSVAGTARDVAAIAQVIAFPFKVLIGVLLEVGLVATALLKSIMHSTEALWQGTSRLLRGDIKGAREAMDSEMKKSIAVLLDANKRGAQVWKDLFTDPPKEGIAVAKDLNEDLATLFADRLSVQKAALDGEIANIKAQAALRTDTEKEALDQSLESLTDFYDHRKGIIQKATDEEVRILEQRRALEAQNPDSDKADEDVARTTADIARARLEGEKALLDLGKERRADIRKAGEELLELDQRILDLQGDHESAAERAATAELRRTKALLDRAGAGAGSKEERDRILADLGRALAIENEMNRVARQANLSFGEFGRQRSAIEQEASAGLISEFQAQERILDLERQRLPGLKALAAEMEAIAIKSGDAERVSQARNFTQSVLEIEFAARSAELSLEKLRATGEDALVGGLADAFSRGASEAETAGQIILGVLRSVSDALRRLVAQALATNIARAIFGIGRAASTGGFDRAFSFGSVTGEFAGGGIVPGPAMFPSTPGGDNRLGFLEVGEHVTRRRVVSEPGALDFLTDFNRFGMAALRSRIRGYSDGGVVEGATSHQGAGNTDITLGLEEGIVVKGMSSPAGRRVILRTYLEHERTLRGRG